MADLETLLTYLTLISVPIGIFYYIMTLNNNRKNQQMQLEARQAQLFMDYQEKIMQEPLNSSFSDLMNWEWTDYNDFVTKYGIPYWRYDEKKGEKRAVQFVDVFAYYEGLGVLVQTNNVDVELIGRFGGVTTIWEKFESIIYEVRSRIGNPYAWGEFEELVIRIHESFDKSSMMSEELNARKRRRKELGLPSYDNR